ncbi:MAG: HupE/UreJ family protein [Cryomorphaceae bacterium]
MISTYFQLGFWHILDITGYDHVLFLAVLIAGIRINDWKGLFTLVSAFTIGHSLTLALTLFNGNLIESTTVEFLIPVTIILASTSNLFWKEKHLATSTTITVAFGLIHGMGFAGYLKALLPTSDSLWAPLLFFNHGVESGQLIFAAFILGLLQLTRYVSKPAVRIAQIGISVVGLAISIFLATNNWIF